MINPLKKILFAIRLVKEAIRNPGVISFFDYDLHEGVIAQWDCGILMLRRIKFDANHEWSISYVSETAVKGNAFGMAKSLGMI